MKNALLSFSFLLTVLSTAFQLQAQQVTYSETKKISNRTPQFRILGKNNEGIILHEYGKFENIIEAYTPAMKMKWRKNLNIKQPNAQIKKILLFPDQANIIYVAPSKESWNIYAQSMDARFTNGIKFSRLDSLYYGKDNLADNLKTAYSNNRDKLVVFYPVPGRNAMNFIVLNKDLELLMRKQVDFPLPDGDYSLNDVIVDDEANIFVILFDNTKVKKDETNYDRLKVFALPNTTYQPQWLNLELNRNLFGKVKFSIDNINKQLCATGFFSDENKKQAKGYFFKAFDITDYTLKRNYQFDFTAELYKQIVGKETGQNLDGLSTFDVTDIVMRFDGGIIIIAESRFTNIENMQIPSFVPAAGPSFRSVTVHYYNDIMVIAISPQGEQEWLNVLRKKQISEDDDGYFSSYAMHIRGGELNIVFNDEVYQKSNIAAYKIDTKGEMKRTVAFNSGDQDILAVPRSGKQVSSNETIIPAFRKNTLKLVKLTYQ
jgi:hypothetical protein